MRKIPFENGEFFHVYNRGTERRDIFLDSSEYARFIHYLYSFNNSSCEINLSRRIQNEGDAISFIGEKNFGESEGVFSKARLIDIAAFCLMPNHFHLLVRQKVDAGISMFMRRLGVAYSMFFNAKYGRTGVLFQGTFKAVHVPTDEYLSHLVQYIHLNPIDLIEPGWKKSGLRDTSAAVGFLENYKWSSYHDFIGKRNFPSVLDASFRQDFFEPSFDHRITAPVISEDIELVSLDWLD